VTEEGIQDVSEMPQASPTLPPTVAETDDEERSQQLPVARMDLEPSPAVVNQPEAKTDDPGGATSSDANGEHALSPADPRRTTAGPMIFGPQGKLQPIPTTVVCDAEDADRVPDTAADWLSSALGEVRAVSARGHMHRHQGEVRQDSFAIGERVGAVVLSVADGVGSASLSHAGSAIAATRVGRSRAVSSILERRIDVADHGLATAEEVDAASAHENADVAPTEIPIDDESHLTARELSSELQSLIFDDIAADIVQEATFRGADSWELSTTLVAAVVLPRHNHDQAYSAVILQIGDSSAWRMRHGEWTELGDSPHEGESLISTGVEPLPSFHEPQVWEEELRAGDVLALMSDGVANILQANEDYAQYLARLWDATAPTPGQLLEGVDAAVKTYDDDRTIVAIKLAP
jgi:serine/threonine protein phosphatase PrpC